MEKNIDLNIDSLHVLVTNNLQSITLLRRYGMVEILWLYNYN